MNLVKNNKIRKVILYHFRQKGVVLLLGIAFLLGVFVGTKLLNLCSEENLEILNEFVNLKKENTFFEILKSSIFSESCMIIFILFCGFCAVGQPLVAFTLFYRGLGLGIIGTFIIQQNENLFIYYALIIVPQTLVFLALQIAASRESIDFSRNFFHQLFSSSTKNLSISTKVYILRFVLILILMVISAFLLTCLQLAISNYI